MWLTAFCQFSIKKMMMMMMMKIVRRPPCWKSTAHLARHARLDLLDWLDKVERVESSRAKWNLSLSQPLHRIIICRVESGQNTIQLSSNQLRHHIQGFVRQRAPRRSSFYRIYAPSSVNVPSASPTRLHGTHCLPTSGARRTDKLSKHY